MSDVRWECVEPGKWYANHDGWVWRAERVNGSEWELLGTRNGIWHAVYPTLAMAKASASLVMLTES